jgi:hypothetical protein
LLLVLRIHFISLVHLSRTNRPINERAIWKIALTNCLKRKKSIAQMKGSNNNKYTSLERSESRVAIFSFE